MATIVLAGHIGRVEAPRKVGESTVVNFSLAESEYVNKEKVTVWYNCSLWNRDGLAPYLQVGTSVSIVGDLTVTTYQTKDGETKPSLNVRVNKVTLLGGGSKTETSENEPIAEDDDSDIPF